MSFVSTGLERILCGTLAKKKEKKKRICRCTDRRHVTENNVENCVEHHMINPQINTWKIFPSTEIKEVSQNNMNEINIFI